MTKSEVYFSIDIESDGPIPGPNSMLSLGAAAFADDETLLSTISVNFELLPGAVPDPSTMKWWATQPVAWAECRKDPRAPVDGMQAFKSWVVETSGEHLPVFVGYPAGYDFLFVYWYLIRFTESSPFSFSALDIKSFAAGVLDSPYRAVSKKTLGRFASKRSHTHVALDDALEQGELFFNIRRHRRRCEQ